MRIQSNLAEVTGRFRRYRGNVDVAIQRALEPVHWRERARQHAEKTLLALAQPAERAFIPEFVRAITAVTFNGLLIALDAPHYSRVAAQMNLAGVAQGKFSALEIPQGELIEFEQQVLQWVSEEKRWKEERDGPKNALTELEKAQWLTHILLAPTLSTTPATEGRMSEQDARDKLLPHLAEYLQRKSTAAKLSPETVDFWLRTVLLQWTAMMHGEFPARVRAELRALQASKSGPGYGGSAVDESMRANH